MSGAVGWIDHCRGDINGAPTLVDNGAFDVLAFDPAFPARNCLTPDVSRVTRINYDRKATGTQDCGVNVQVSSQPDKRVRVIAALNVRLAADVSQVNVRVKDTGPTVLETATVYLSNQFAAIPGTEDRYDFFWILSQERQVSDVEFLFKFPASSIDYFEIGRLWAGPGIVWPNGVGVDWSMTGVDPSRIYRSEGGGYAAFPYPTRKVLNITKRGLDYDDAMGGYQITSLREMFLGAGMSNPVVVISSTATQHRAQTGSVYGLITRVPQIDHLGRILFGTSLSVEQLR